MRSRRLSLGLALGCTAPLLAAHAAHGQPAEGPLPTRGAPLSHDEPPRANLTTVEGRIVGTEEGHLVVDIGGRSGAAAGDTGELWRPVEMRHPVTKRLVEDRYRIGRVRITEALQVMSFAEVTGEPRQKPRTGDIVVLRVARPEPLSGSEPKSRADKTAAPRDAESESVAALVDSLRGADLATRLGAIDTWLRANPENRHAAALREEAALLRRLSTSAERPAAASSGESAPEPTPPARVVQPEAPPASVPIPRGYEEPRVERFVPAVSAFSGAPLDIGIDVSGTVKGVLLHSRHSGEVGYVATVMRTEGRDFWVATVDAERVRAPGLDYFIEIVRIDGVAIPVVGNADAPLSIRVTDAPRPAPPSRHHSTASVYTDYADYNRLRGNDRAFQTEGFLGVRFDDVGFRALRTGFGVYRGVGGSVEDLDVLDLAPRSVGLTYGYLEGEFGISPTLSVIGRGALGLRDQGVSGGGQLHLRIGSDLDTNLSVGGEVLGGVGLRGIFQLEILPQGLVPFTTRVELTNQPGGEVGQLYALPGESTHRSEIAGRLVAQVGYRVLPSLVVFARLSAQGRTINHFGPGFGGGATFEW